MSKLKVVTLLAVLALGATTMSAQNTRSWVSGVGDDANPCTRTAPCKTWAGAISKTAAGGEVDSLDPGGFGALTITKAITLDGGGGQVSSVLVTGTNGIVVAAGASDVVIIRNIRFDGLLGNNVGATPGINAINYISGKLLLIDKCQIFGFSNSGVNIALTASGQLSITDTTIQNVASTGIAATTSSGLVTVGIDKVRVELATNGIQAGANSVVNVNNSDVGFTTTGFNNVAGTFNSYGNNHLHDNTNNTAGSITLVALQ